MLALEMRPPSPPPQLRQTVRGSHHLWSWQAAASMVSSVCYTQYVSIIGGWQIRGVNAAVMDQTLFTGTGIREPIRYSFTWVFWGVFTIEGQEMEYKLLIKRQQRR